MRPRSAGFTLIEIMIVIVIISILAAIAIPAYQSYLLRGGRADGKSMLLGIMQAQERFFSQNQTYTTNLGTGGLGYAGVAANAGAPSGEKRYLITAQACENNIALCVQLTATRQASQTADTECGNLIIDSRGNKSETGSSTADVCW